MGAWFQGVFTLAVAALLAGCEGNVQGTPMSAYHDAKRGVTCWSRCQHGCGVSCLPDAWLRDGGAP